jgi:transposase
LGSVRLDEYLREHDLGWVVRLREELGKVDFSLLEMNYEGTGRPAYHPRLMLGLAVYGVLKRQSTLRELEDLAVIDAGAWWITGGEQPDHSTMGDFLNRHAEQITKEFFGALVAGLVKRLKIKNGTVAGDGTVVEAAGSRFQLLSLEAAEQVAAKAKEKAEKQPDDAALKDRAKRAEDVACVARERETQRRERGTKTGMAVVSPIDPEAVLQKCKDGRRRSSFKPVVLVHESGLIAAQTVEPSSEPAALPELLNQYAHAFGEDPKRSLYDAGFHNISMLQDAAARAIDVLCPSGSTQDGQWERQGNNDKFGKLKFAYDAEGDRYLCPAGKWLTPGAWHRHTRTGHRVRKFRTKNCQGCVLRSQCVSGKGGRTIVRFEGEELKEMMEEVLAQPRARREYRRRAAIVERVFAEIGWRQGLKRFRRHGRHGSGLEFGLHCIAFNLKWAVRRGASGARTGAFRHQRVSARLLRIWVRPIPLTRLRKVRGTFELRMAASSFSPTPFTTVSFAGMTGRICAPGQDFRR